MAQRNIAIIGAQGMLGRYLSNEFPEAVLFDLKGSEIVKRIDISSRSETGYAFLDFNRGDIINNAAAYTDVDGAETREGEEKSFSANVKGVKNLSDIALDRGFRLMHFSTAYVFDGRKGNYSEGDKQNPYLSVYAKHKYIGEKSVASASGTILRTDCLYGQGGKNFVDSMIYAALKRDSLEVVEDQIGCPTYAKDVAHMTRKIVDDGKFGRIHHTVNSGSCSRKELAERIVNILGLESKIIGISTQDYNSKYRKNVPTATRPKDCSLAPSEHYALRGWEEALKDYLSVRRSEHVSARRICHGME